MRAVDEERDLLLNEISDAQPRATYAASKLAGQRGLLALRAAIFAPVALRMEMLFGFSPRMRYQPAIANKLLTREPEPDRNKRNVRLETLASSPW